MLQEDEFAEGEIASQQLVDELVARDLQNMEG